MTARQAKRTKAHPVSPTLTLLEVPPQILGDDAALRRAERRHRAALGGFEGGVVIVATSHRMPPDFDLAAYDAIHGNA